MRVSDTQEDAEAIEAKREEFRRRNKAELERLIKAGIISPRNRTPVVKKPPLIPIDVQLKSVILFILLVYLLLCF